MAQTRSHAKQATSNDAKGAVPASYTRASRLPSSDLVSRAANPFGLMRRLSEDMDQFFGQLIGGTGTAGWPLPFAPTVDWIPALEVFERDGNLVIQADLPGLSVDDVSVEVTDGLVTISGERRESRAVDDDGLRRTERRYGRFVRSIALPEDTKVEDVKASFRDGVLEITVPLTESSQQRHTVDIQATSESQTAASSGRQTAASSGSQTAASSGSQTAASSGSGSPGATAATA